MSTKGLNFRIGLFFLCFLLFSFHLYAPDIEPADAQAVKRAARIIRSNASQAVIKGSDGWNSTNGLQAYFREGLTEAGVKVPLTNSQYFLLLSHIVLSGAVDTNVDPNVGFDPFWGLLTPKAQDKLPYDSFKDAEYAHGIRLWCAETVVLDPNATVESIEIIFLRLLTENPLLGLRDFVIRHITENSSSEKMLLAFAEAYEKAEMADRVDSLVDVEMVIEKAVRESVRNRRAIITETTQKNVINILKLRLPETKEGLAGIIMEALGNTRKELRLTSAEFAVVLEGLIDPGNLDWDTIDFIERRRDLEKRRFKKIHPLYSDSEVTLRIVRILTGSEYGRVRDWAVVFRYYKTPYPPFDTWTRNPISPDLAGKIVEIAKASDPDVVRDGFLMVVREGRMGEALSRLAKTMRTDGIYLPNIRGRRVRSGAVAARVTATNPLGACARAVRSDLENPARRRELEKLARGGDVAAIAELKEMDAARGIKAVSKAKKKAGKR